MLVALTVGLGTVGIAGLSQHTIHPKSLSKFCSVAPYKEARLVRAFLYGLTGVRLTRGLIKIRMSHGPSRCQPWLVAALESRDPHQSDI
jgi:hypothetical protein